MFIGTKSFPRSLQLLDEFSCGSRAIYSVMGHFGVSSRPHRFVIAELRTSPDTGTAVIRALRQHGLLVRYRPVLNWRPMVHALKAGAVAIVHVDQDHFVVVHGVDDRHVHLSDSSLIRCPGRTQSKVTFLAQWTRWGLLVSRKPGRPE
jgi:ABC-type bacteriocin/lantibiotic exporter with double-glycine peptidase domain